MSKSRELLEIIVKPAKPVAVTPEFLDIRSDKIQVELKYDGTRAVILKDSDDGYYKFLSSSGNWLKGNFLNILKELRPMLDAGYCLSGEIIDSENPLDRGMSLSVAKNGKYPPTRPLFIAWNCFLITDEMKKAGVITPDLGSGLPPYDQMRMDLLTWLRKLRPKQVKAAKRFKLTKDMIPSKVLELVMSRGEEGIVVKSKAGGESWKIKGKFPVQEYPLVKFNYSTSTTHGGKVTSLDVVSPYGKVMTVGQGYNGIQIDKLTNLALAKNNKTDDLYVGFVGSKPTKPIDQGGSWSNPTFVYLSDKNSKIIE